ncbi:hypothetical protein C8R44DRAFT_743573 [Mycena epipterygia]|nr:hypothetical protein C8R44DRAFT_743573 [Mycena epipterygia]
MFFLLRLLPPVFLFIALILLLLATLSTPIIKSIFLRWIVRRSVQAGQKQTPPPHSIEMSSGAVDVEKSSPTKMSSGAVDVEKSQPTATSSSAVDADKSQSTATSSSAGDGGEILSKPQATQHLYPYVERKIS